MDAHQRAEVLKVISDTQGAGTAAVQVQIGGVKSNGQVDHDCLIIKNAPARIVSDLSDMGYSLSVTGGGVRVE